MPNPYIHQHPYEPVSTVEEAREHHMRIMSNISDIDAMKDAIMSNELQEREDENE